MPRNTASRKKGRTRLVAVLGGSFNPPHLAHLLVAQEVLRSLGCDEVWLMPCYRQAEGKNTEPAKHRLAMVRLLLETIKHDPRVKASDFEVRLRKTSYTADTVQKLQEKFPSTRFYWIFGSELVSQFPRWKKWTKLRGLLPLVIYPRPGSRMPSKKVIDSLQATFLFPREGVKKSSLSSTKARNLALKKSPGLRAIVGNKVFDYVRRNGLYGWGSR